MVMFAQATPPRSWVVVALLLAAGLLTGCTDLADGSWQPQIVEVIDGDTVVISFGEHHSERVRLLGVDTPETVDPSRPVQCYGAEASAFVRSAIPPGTIVRLERDVEARDHFGRLLAYVYRADDDLFVNAELLRLGYADIAIYEPNTYYDETLSRLVTSARTQNSGLWGVCGSADVAIDPPPIQIPAQRS